MSRSCRESSGFVRRALGLSSAITLASAMFLSTAHAQSLDFSVPGGSLKDALAAYVQQTGVQLLYREDDIRGLTTAGASGTLSVEEALNRILAGTSLTVQRESSGAIAISRAAPTRKDSESQTSKLEKTGLRLAQADIASGPQSTPAATASSAQERETSAQQRAFTLDEVIVTGSHIRGSENLTVPLIVMDREYINSTGLTTTVQLVESLPQNFALVNQSVTGGSLSGNSYSDVQGSAINLRGIGEGTTLTLINGRRLPLGYDGSTVNIAALPLSAIERVEVVTDGASALYGSDAVGGVVNFILRKDFEGAETSVRGGLADDVDELRVSQTFGYGWDSGNVVVSGEYFKRDMLLGTDRDFGIGERTMIGSLLPEEKIFGATLFGRQNLTERLALFVDVLYTDRDSVNRSSHVTPTSDKTNFIDNQQLSVTTGLTFDFADGWRAELSGGYGEDDASIDFVNPPSPQIVRGSVPSRFEFTGTELKVDGPLFELPGGMVRLAAGAQWRDESLRSRSLWFDPADVPLTDVTYEYDREVSSFYTEAAVPIVGAGNAFTAVQRLELSLAARYDEYSDFGSSTDPRVGIAWKPTQDLTLRGSWGTSYLAPKVREFDVAFNSALAIDGEPSADFLHVLVVNGNAVESLGPQESENFTIGLDWTPAAVPGLRFVLSYYDIEYSKKIEALFADFPTIAANPSAYESVAIFNPSAGQVLEYIGYGTLGNYPFMAFDGNFLPNPNFDPADVDLIYDARRRNLGVIETTGFDVSVSYGFDAFGGRMQLALDGSRIEELAKKFSATAPKVEVLDTFSNPTKWRARGQVGFRTGGWTANAFVHYRNSYVDNRFLPYMKLDAYTTVDLCLSYDFGDGSGVLANSTIAVSAINAFDEDPPAARVRQETGVFDLGFDPANASPLGRLLSIDITKRW